MGVNGKDNDDPHKLWKYIIAAFVSITHVIAFFQIVICSRHLAVAFNIPAKNIGIYFAKLYSLRSLLMSAGCGVEYGIFKATSTLGDKNIRKYFSMAWFVMLTICEVSFLCVLYFSKNVAFHNYIVLNLEGMFFGFFQMSVLSLIPEFATYYMLSLYVSGTCIFIIQTIIDRCTKDSILSVKIQSWICVICSVICLGIWPVRLFFLKDSQGKKAQNCNGQTTSSSPGAPGAASTTTTTTQQVSGNGGGVGVPGVPGGAGLGTGGMNGSSGSSAPSNGGETGKPFPFLISLIFIALCTVVTFFKKFINNGQTQNSRARRSLPKTYPSPDLEQTKDPKIQYLMTMSPLTILKIMTSQLTYMCQSLNPEAIVKVQILIMRLQQITNEREITEQLLLAIDMVILSIKSSCPPDQSLLLAQLSLFLRIKTVVKMEKQEEVDTKKSTESTESRSTRRVRRSTNGKSTPTKQFHDHLLASLSPLMMFGTGSLVKDFLFPGVIPYGLLERDKCHLINLIVIIFLSIGPLTIFLINENFMLLKEKVEPYHYFWTCMIPKIVILIISLCAIHTKQGCTHKIRSSQGIVLFMTVVLLTCYGFLETLSFVGMAFYVKLIAKDTSLVDLQAIHNVSGKFFRYLVYKVSVGYNKTRIGAGFVLPSFKPPEPIPNTFGFWFCGTFSNGWKDIKGDFKMGIQQYLAATQTVSKKSPIETLRYCDLLM